MLINVIITVVILTVAAAVCFSFLGNYIVNERSNTLYDEAARINDMTAYYIENKSPDIDNVYNMIIENVSMRINGVVIIADNVGEVITSKNASKHLAVDRLKAGNMLVDQKTVTVGNMGGIFYGDYLIVSTPFEYNGQIVGTTVLAVPAPEINKVKYSLFNIFLSAVLISTVIAMILAYMYSRRVSRPLKALGKAAKSVANGNFDVQVDCTGDDEIADLTANFNQMVLSLKGLEDMRQDFISNVSHELRTPMTTIAGFVDGIIDGTIPPDEQEKYLIIVRDEVKRLARLVSQLLALSRIDAGTMTLNLKKFDINELIRITILRFEKALMDKNIDVRIDFEEDRTFVSADKDAISRVLTNLFDNAVKFNYRGGYIKIAVSTKGENAVISVENSGIGISEEELRHIWERFYKTDKSRSYDKNGLGLGLYMVHNIINLHGGEIKAESEKDKWARFTFTLKKV